MFLTRLLVVMSLLCVVFTLCAGCSVRHDADELANRRVSGARVDPAVGEYSLLGLHRDHGADLARVRRAEHLAGDPKLVPSAREQRMARAMAEAEARLVRQGGMMLYRWDGSASKPTKVDFVASPGALTLNYAASEKLNRTDGESHALLLVVYHLSDRAAFDQLATHEDGIRKLLEGERFDDSVKRVRTFDVQPGARGQLLFDRPEGGKFVALVAGYARPSGETSVYVTEYGLGRWKMPGKTIFERDQYLFSPQPLTIEVRLGQCEMAAKNSGKMLGMLQNTQDMTFEQVQHILYSELGWGTGKLSLPSDSID